MPPNINSRPLSRKSEVGFILRTVWPGVLAFMTAFMLAVGCAVLWPLWLTRDVRNAPVRSDVGIVTAIVLPSGTRANPVPKPRVMIHMKSGLAEFRSFDRYVVGETVRVRYRVGRSGLIYVDAADPLDTSTR